MKRNELSKTYIEDVLKEVEANTAEPTIEHFIIRNGVAVPWSIAIQQVAARCRYHTLLVEQMAWDEKRVIRLEKERAMRIKKANERKDAVATAGILILIGTALLILRFTGLW